MGWTRGKSGVSCVIPYIALKITRVPLPNYSCSRKVYTSLNIRSGGFLGGGDLFKESSVDYLKDSFSHTLAPATCHYLKINVDFLADVIMDSQYVL